MSDIPDDIARKAYIVASNVRYHIAAHDVELIKHDQAVADLIAKAIQEERERWEDKVDGLSTDLDSAIEVAFKRGATEWVRLNYPKHFTRPMGDERKGE